MRVVGWRGAWPDSSGDYSAYLPVNFEVELASGVDKRSCLIGQEMRGETSYYDYRRIGRIATPTLVRRGRTLPSWTADAPRGQTYWWDGSSVHAGAVSWSLGILGPFEATFSDAPGFHTVSGLGSLLGLLSGRGVSGNIGAHSFPIYWGGVGGAGHFEFRTFVRDASTGRNVRQLTWGMLIDYPAASGGRKLFYL